MFSYRRFAERPRRVHLNCGSDAGVCFFFSSSQYVIPARQTSRCSFANIHTKDSQLGPCRRELPLPLPPPPTSLPLTRDVFTAVVRGIRVLKYRRRERRKEERTADRINFGGGWSDGSPKRKREARGKRPLLFGILGISKFTTSRDAGSGYQNSAVAWRER